MEEAKQKKKYILSKLFPSKSDFLKISLYILFVYFVFKPFYFFESGLPQISDIILLFLYALLLIGLFLLNTIQIIKSKSWVILNMLFVFYIIIVNGIWAIILDDEKLLFVSFWYVYNLLTIIVFIFLAKRYSKKLLEYVYFSVIISLLLQFIIFLLLPDNSYRHTNFFNNPNQLAYYALLSQAIIFVLCRKVDAKHFILYIGIITSFTLIFISLSKAAIVSSMLMYIVFLLFNGKSFKFLSWLNVLLIMIVMVLFPIYHASIDNNLISAVIDRLASIGTDADDRLAGRGYDRIWNHPEYLLFGAGEGVYERFESQISGSEVHSTLGNILFSYGFIGFFLFNLILLRLMVKQKLIDYYPILFVLLYGLAHNGIRQTFFWILITLIYICSNTKKLNSDELR